MADITFSGRMGGSRKAQFQAPPQKSKSARQTLARLWSFSGPDHLPLLVLVLFVTVSVAVGLVVPWLVGRAIDTIAGGKGQVDWNLLGVILGVLLAGYLADALSLFWQGWVIAGVSQRIIQRLRTTIFSKLQRLPLAYFDQRTHGEMLSRFSNDVDNISTTVSQTTVQLISSVLVLTGSFILMLTLSPLLTLATLITVPLAALLSRTISRKTRVLFREQQDLLGELNGHAEETISGAAVVKAFGRETQVVEHFEAVNSRLRKVVMKALLWTGFIVPIMNVIGNLGFVAVAGVGSILAVQGVLTVGLIASFISYSRLFSRPLPDLANVWNSLQTAIAGTERVFEVLDQTEEVPDVVDATILDHPRGEVHFKNVSFGYRPEILVFSGLSFNIKPGQKVAIVGPTGAGKTSIVNLLTRFYDPVAGSIELDGRDLRSYTRSSLCRNFGVVLQDTYLFSGTIRDNVLYGRPGATETELRRAIRISRAEHFIYQLPQGLETPLNESGGNLSQGQRQLLAISRAVLCDPPILILDEATSNVDTRTELSIQEAMVELMKDRTSVVIAHRLSTTRSSDLILVIDGGQIVERGNHDQLACAGGIYQRMLGGRT